MPQKFYRVSCWVLLTLVSLFAVATIIAGVFQCVPVEKAWYKNTPGHCYPIVHAWYANAVFSIVTDCVILALPMRMVYQMQRDVREKALLFMIFGLGIFVTITSIFRTTALHVGSSADTTYQVASGYWSIIEVNVGVICVCLPPLRALLVRFISIHASTHTGSYSNPSGASSSLRHRSLYKISVDDPQCRGRTGAVGAVMAASEEQLFAMRAMGGAVAREDVELGRVDAKRAIVRKTETRVTTSVRESGGQVEGGEGGNEKMQRARAVEGEEERWRAQSEMGKERPQWYCRPQKGKV